MRQGQYPTGAAVRPVGQHPTFYQDDFEVGGDPHPLIGPVVPIPGFLQLAPQWRAWCPAGLDQVVVGLDAGLQRGVVLASDPIAPPYQWGGATVDMLDRVPSTDWAGFLYGRTGLLLASDPTPRPWNGYGGMILSTGDLQGTNVAPFIHVGSNILFDGAFPIDSIGADSSAWPTPFGAFNLSLAPITGGIGALTVYSRVLCIYVAAEDELILITQVSPDGLSWWTMGRKELAGNLRSIGFGATGRNDNVNPPNGGYAWCDYLRFDQSVLNEGLLINQLLLTTSAGRNYP